MTELEEAYECLFEFDILNRVIRVYDRYQYDNRTDICLSTEDVLQGLTLRTKSDEIKTALLVKGGNGLDILSVNPLGTNLIYNFSYYATEEWMDAALIEKVKNWQAMWTPHELRKQRLSGAACGNQQASGAKSRKGRRDHPPQAGAFKLAGAAIRHHQRYGVTGYQKCKSQSSSPANPSCKIGAEHGGRRALFYSNTAQHRERQAFGSSKNRCA